ncbi:helix-turn-helix domain-containing protein [Actinoalloteichus sp. AHMU CJ021]|uniref:OmpR/PhoB-type domain-containing protein n=1 Tax=Actinoalloteichus caeruleus DSM 43889 TaxID=1120930 RepID=A0ABT1JP87_ACTCY|nr:helix-turn-helix domain-containing protein [Actinoalloteichus caeruleus]AUS80130.1 helix-turn-helix domain-containing protein [Actinoalloteichus sp. AHMU CJ021]MCP2334342.1 hypothetical protein [Actinoalloteichus caeruleus DSM 43889]
MAAEFPRSAPWRPVAAPAEERSEHQLRATHEAVLGGDLARRPRPLVWESWQRSLAAEVRPDSPVPEIGFDRAELAARRSAHPLAAVLPELRELLVGIADEAVHLMIVTDAEGHILWREGHRDLCHRADRVGLREGTCWSEDAMGTNAMGTALAVRRAVRIHSAEHLVRTYHPWTCAASPVRDPDSGAIVGSVDVTGPLSSAHPATAALVRAAVELAQARLAERMRERDSWLRHRHGSVLRRRPGELRAVVTPTGRVVGDGLPGWVPARVVPVVDGAGRRCGWRIDDGTVPGLGPGAASWEPLDDGCHLLRLSTRPHQRGRSARPARGARPARPAGRDRSLAVGGGAEEEPAVPATSPLPPGPPGPGGSASPPRGVSLLRLLGTTPSAVVDGREVRLSVRHCELLLALILHRGGLTASELALHVHGEHGSPVTVRAELHRLRRRLTPQVLTARPYRLSPAVRSDVEAVRSALDDGRTGDAVAAYTGELLVASEAPLVRAEREVLHASVRAGVLRDGDPAVLLRFHRRCAVPDSTVLERLVEVLPAQDPRRALAEATLRTG